MENKTVLTEADFIKGLGNAVTSNVKRAGNAAAALAGSQRAVGRMDRDKVARELNNAWRRYAGRHGIKTATLGTMQAFLKSAYGIVLPSAALGKVEDKAEATAEKPTEKPTETPAVEEPKPTAESVNLNEFAADDTIDPVKFFPILANMLIDQGLVDVTRDGKLTSGAGNASADEKKKPTPDKNTVASKGAGNGSAKNQASAGETPAADSTEAPAEGGEAEGEGDENQTANHRFDFKDMNNLLGRMHVDMPAINGARALAQGDWNDFMARYNALPKAEKTNAQRIMFAALKAIKDV
jgi:hypothetical protein